MPTFSSQSIWGNLWFLPTESEEHLIWLNIHGQGAGQDNQKRHERWKSPLLMCASRTPGCPRKSCFPSACHASPFTPALNCPRNLTAPLTHIYLFLRGESDFFFIAPESIQEPHLKAFKVLFINSYCNAKSGSHMGQCKSPKASYQPGWNWPFSFY